MAQLNSPVLPMTVPRSELSRPQISVSGRFCSDDIPRADYRGHMTRFQPNTYEEIQDRFCKVFHRDMTLDERRCFLSVDKYWMSGYFLGITVDSNEEERHLGPRLANRESS